MDNATNIPAKGGLLKTLNTIIWTTASILAVLTLITATVVALRIGDFVPNEWDVIFLVPKTPSAEFSDDKEVWSTENKIDFFKSEYVNGEQQVTVQSGNGDKVFAPGSQTSYTFRVKNNGNMAIDYDIDMYFGFFRTIDEIPLLHSPLVARIYSAEKQGYIIGSDTEWASIADVKDYTDSGTLGINSYNEYTIDLMWQFEGGKDDFDTFLGNLANDEQEAVNFSLAINTSAEQSADPHALGGVVDKSSNIKQTGGDIDIPPFAALLAVAALVGIGLGSTLAVKAKVSKAPVVIVPPVTKKEEPEPVIPETPAKQKKKRFKKKRIINSQSGRWKNHKKRSKRKR